MLEWFIWPFVVLPIILITAIMVFGFLIWDEIAKLRLDLLQMQDCVDNLSLAVLSLNEKPKKKTTSKKGKK